MLCQHVSLHIADKAGYLLHVSYIGGFPGSVALMGNICVFMRLCVMHKGKQLYRRVLMMSVNVMLHSCQ